MIWSMKKAVMLINDTTYAFNPRGAIIEKLVQEGFEVVIVEQLLKHQNELKKWVRADWGRNWSPWNESSFRLEVDADL